MTPDDHVRAQLWAAVLAAVSKLTETTPGAYETAPHSGCWITPGDTYRSNAKWSANGVEGVYRVYDRNGGALTEYVIRIDRS